MNRLLELTCRGMLWLSEFELAIAQKYSTNFDYQCVSASSVLKRKRVGRRVGVNKHRILFEGKYIYAFPAHGNPLTTKHKSLAIIFGETETIRMVMQYKHLGYVARAVPAITIKI